MKNDVKNSPNFSVVDNGGAYLEALYEDFLLDPMSVDPQWRAYFQTLPGAAKTEVPRSPVEAKFLAWAQQQPMSVVAVATSDKQAAVTNWINAYRALAHHIAKIDPLGLMEREKPAALDLAHYGLGEADATERFTTDIPVLPEATLSEIQAFLEKTYAGSIAVEWDYIESEAEKAWLIQQFEVKDRVASLPADLRKRAYGQLTAAEGLERYLHSKYVGQKRFSLEGGDTLIPMIDECIMQAGEHLTSDVVIGMAHRGRLNVLVNLLGKPPAGLFEEFEGKKGRDSKRSGDVKYHQGFSSDVKTQNGIVHLSLAPNPSHLEIVSPVVEGSVRARQDRLFDGDRNSALPILIHGDAAFAGQGCIMEMLNMSQTRGYGVGGSIHLVVNNQVGFTTSNPHDSRSTPYCTDIAKMIQSPVFHVNGDDPDAALFVVRLAMAYRYQFKKDIVIDLVCYRRHGHNEADEPAATQPLMYQVIRSHATVRELYAKTLTQAGLMTQADADAWVERYRAQLDKGEVIVAHLTEDGHARTQNEWANYLAEADWNKPVKTAIDEKTFKTLGKAMSTLPADFTAQTQVKKVFADREKMAAGELPMDWGFAENLAYASLLQENYGVRLSGQDCGRGTFSHRHAVLHDQKTDACYMPLAQFAKPYQWTVIDSLLSEEAVLAFEYGYSTTRPKTLVLWEAQFGDFANGAQVVTDQFIASGEQKWNRLSGLVLLLPHGYEGMGPEHSSARLERYLQLCAEHNMRVCTPTTPAQIFHLLRQQMLQSFRKPLVVMTPKSLLRHRLAISTMQDLTQGGFAACIGEVEELKPTEVKRIVVCGGKVYYDLLQRRTELKLKDVAIIRIEQLYPFPEEMLKAELAKYPNAKTVAWCQEEPQNQGAWYCSNHHLQACLQAGQSLVFAGRPASASPATGYHHAHVEQQAALVAEALGS